ARPGRRSERHRAALQRAARPRHRRGPRLPEHPGDVVMRHARNIRSRGQALAELGIVIVLFVFLGLGIIEFGRAWMIINIAKHAARDGARAAAALPTGSRDANGFITNWAGIETAVENQILDNTGQTMTATGDSNA